jgi:hypothetical protein
MPADILESIVSSRRATWIAARRHSYTSMLVATFFLAFAFDPFAAYASDPVGVPLFHFRDGTTHSIGKAFAVKWFNNRNLLICPLHLLGPAGGYATYVDPRFVPDVIESVEIMDLQKRDVLASAKRGLLRKGSPVEKGSGDLCDDLMAFDLPNAGSLTLFGLSAQLPAVGTKVRTIINAAPAACIYRRLYTEIGK